VSESEADSFERLTAFVEAELDFATSHYNDSYLKRRFASRMRRRGTESYSEYLAVLEDDPDEHVALLDALAINVTGFFRNPEVWEGIRGLLRELTDENRQVSAWSAGCADGREPYSLAMLARDDPRTEADAVDIRATDINEAALRSAREGVYQATRTIDIDEQLRFLSNYHRYIDRDGDRFEIRGSLKDNVTFEHHDLIRDPPKSEVDLVVCRNLFIYIDGEYKEPVLENVRRSLEPGGYLVIGKAETIPTELRDEFAVLDAELRIYQRE